MQIDLRIAVWNANGVPNKLNEIEFFMKTKHIDLFLISETHLTTKSYVKIRGYDFVCTNHPDGKAHAGAGLFIKSTIRYEIAEEFCAPYIQASGIKLVCNNRTVSIYSIYLPPRHSISCEQFENFFKKLGPRFVVAGDYNAKHPWWGSRLANPKGRNLYKCMLQNNYSSLSGGRPTYWPTDPNKIPDLLDFVVYGGIPRSCLDISNEDDLSSDHTPIVVNYNANIELAPKKVKLIKNNTDRQHYGHWIEQNINLGIKIKTGDDLDDAVESLTTLIHEAAVLSTPTTKAPQGIGTKVQASADLREMIRQQRRLRRIWQRTRNPLDKTNWNRAIKMCSERLAEQKNDNTALYLKKLSPNNKNKDHELFNATKYLKRPTKRNIPIKNEHGSWCRTDSEKATTFADHLERTFQPLSLNENENEVVNFLDVACQMEIPIKHITPSETRDEIKSLNDKKSTGHDRIDAIAIKYLPMKCIIFLTLIFNSILRLQHFPSQWKCAEIIMVPKPNKIENLVSSYRPISLLPIFSKIFERLLLKRLLPIIEKKNIIPDHQFGFRHKHGTPEQCHRIINVLTDTFETKKYCSAVFLDIYQAFDKVWHTGLLYKLKNILPAPFYLFFKSYLSSRSFYVKVNDDFSNILQIKAGIPQGSVLGPVLYTIFTSDMPTVGDITVATYADDTAFLYSNESPTEASRIIQIQLNSVQHWLTKWNIKVNTQKSKHVTFTLRRDNCPSVFLNGTELPSATEVNYLGLHLDRRLTWKEHIKAKRKQLDIKFKQMYWLLGPKSQLSLENKILLYKTILKPIWTYGIQLWGTASNSNIEILQRFQSKTLRSIANAPWFVTNNTLHNDFKIPTVKCEIKKVSCSYLERLSNHINPLAITLLDETNTIRRLKRNHVLDLPFI